MRCPTSNQLRHWLAGRLSDAESTAIEAHVEQCIKVCQPALDRMSGFDQDSNEGNSSHSWLGVPAFTVPADAFAADRRAAPIRRDRGPGVLEPGPTVAVAPEMATIGHYRLLGILGSGGMGTVYKALHTKLEKLVALKVLPADKMRHPRAGARCGREMRAVGRLDHPNIVVAHDADDADGVPYLVMELVDGIDLATLVQRRGPLPIAIACELVRQAALGLQHAHEHGLVHRDVKPSNLMLAFAHGENRANVKILDLGLALLNEPCAEVAAEMTAVGAIMGTIDYMAPEQASDTHAVDGRADVYSLGATLYKLLTGQAPFVGRKYKTTLQRLLALAEVAPADVAALRPEVSPELAAVVRTMMAKDPAARFATPRAAAEALAPFAVGAQLDSLGDARIWSGQAGSLAANPLEPGPLEPGPLETGAVETFSAQLRLDTVADLPTTRDWKSGQGGPTPATAVRSRRVPRRGKAILAAVVGLVALAGASFAMRVQNAEGELIVESDVDGVAVNIIRDREQVRSGWRVAQGTKLLVPAFFYPAGEGLIEWERLIAASAHAPVVVIANPSNGPGKEVDPNYAGVIRRGVRAGAQVIGYVHTDYGNGALDDWRADIDQWLRLYPDIDGFFFDGSPTGAEQLAQYAELYAYAKGKHLQGVVVARPGVDWSLILGVHEVEQVPKQVERYVAQGARYLCITDKDEGDPNCWGRLPSYWEAEVNAFGRE